MKKIKQTILIAIIALSISIPALAYVRWEAPLNVATPCGTTSVYMVTYELNQWSQVIEVGRRLMHQGYCPNSSQ